MIHGDQHVTWSQLDGLVDELARGLSQLGAVAGHRVAISMLNRIELVTSYLAALRGGWIAVPINPTSTPTEVAAVLADSGSRVCFADPATIDAVREAVRTSAVGRQPGRDAEPLAGTPLPTVIVVDGQPLSGERGYGDVAAAGADVVSPKDHEALAVLVYAAGTNGRARAAMLSHRALIANIDQAARTRPAPMRPDDVVLGALPLFDIYGLNAVLGQVLLQGSALVLAHRLDPDETLRLVSTQRVTCVAVAPSLVGAWARRGDLGEKLTSVRTLLSGAAPLAADVVRQFEQRSGVTVDQGYGLTEAGPVVTSTLGTTERKRGWVGRALPGVELRVVDDTGTPVRSGEPGEICVRGRNLFSGYWPDGEGAPAPGGWLATGDLGFLDADGDLFLVDRLSEAGTVSATGKVVEGRVSAGESVPAKSPT